MKNIFSILIPVLLFSSCKKDGAAHTPDIADNFVGTYYTNNPADSLYGLNMLQVTLKKKSANTLTLNAVCTGGYNFFLQEVTANSYYNGYGLLTIGETAAIAGYTGCTFSFVDVGASYTVSQPNLILEIVAQEQTGSCNTGTYGKIDYLFTGNKQ